MCDAYGGIDPDSVGKSQRYVMLAMNELQVSGGGGEKIHRIPGMVPKGQRVRNLGNGQNVSIAGIVPEFLSS